MQRSRCRRSHAVASAADESRDQRGAFDARRRLPDSRSDRPKLSSRRACSITALCTPAATPCSPFVIRVKGLHRKCRPECSNRSSPPRSTAKAPGWDLRWCERSRPIMKERSAFAPHRARGRSSMSTSRCRPLLAAQSAVADTERPRGDGRIVMVVDDDRAVLEMTEEMLARLGYEPVGYEAAADALRALRAHPDRFDLVLTDESMPELAGTQLAVHIKELRPDLPVIVASGYGGPDLHGRALAAGARAVLSKPYDSSSLAQALRPRPGGARHQLRWPPPDACPSGPCQAERPPLKLLLTDRNRPAGHTTGRSCEAREMGAVVARHRARSGACAQPAPAAADSPSCCSEATPAGARRRPGVRRVLGGTRPQLLPLEPCLGHRSALRASMHPIARRADHGAQGRHPVPRCQSSTADNLSAREPAAVLSFAMPLPHANRALQHWCRL